MSKGYETLQKSRNKRKEDMVHVMGDHCQLCGYNKCIIALEFHHINPSEKEFNFNKAISMDWEKTRLELEKCILLCANCHREVHAGLIPLESIHSSFIKKRADEVSERIFRLKTHQDTYCQNCGAVVSAHNILCPKCAAELRRVVERPPREILKDEIRTIPFLQLSKKYGVTDNAIRKWCKAYNLPFKKSKINIISDDDWIKI